MQKSCLKMAFFALLPVMFSSSPVFAIPMDLVQKPFWDFGVQALYLKSSYTDGIAYVDDTRVAVNTDRRNPLKLNWDWGFKVEGSYHFCPNSDINLNWYHYRSTANGSFVFRTNPTADTYSVTPDWNAINLEFGQSIHFDQIKLLRLYGGLQAARIKTSYSGQGVDPVAGTGTENYSMKYTGIGPRMGADLSVGLFPVGISAYFGADAAMLVGKSEFNFAETFGTAYAISGSRPTVVVPEVELKIGARYDYAFSSCNVMFDAGYMLINYFSPLNLSDDFNTSETNFALNGVYFGVKVMI